MVLVSEHALMFAQLIARTAKDIDVLVESLPSEESSAELQVFKGNHTLHLGQSATLSAILT